MLFMLHYILCSFSVSNWYEIVYYTLLSIILSKALSKLFSITHKDVVDLTIWLQLNVIHTECFTGQRGTSVLALSTQYWPRVYFTTALSEYELSMNLSFRQFWAIASLLCLYMKIYLAVMQIYECAEQLKHTQM